MLQIGMEGYFPVVKPIRMTIIALVVLFPLLNGRGFAEPKDGGVVIFGRGDDSVTLDPAKSADVESIKVLANIFEGLVCYKKNATKIEPCLAISWESSKNGTDWIFHLRKGVLFHDGTMFNADAVIFSFLRQIDTNHAHYSDDFKLAGTTFRYFENIERVDDYTVRISLKKPYAPFLNNLATVSASIVSPKAVNRWKNNFSEHPVGTGPFRFVKWFQKDRIVLNKNAMYWGRPPYLDALVYKSTPDNQDRLLELKTSAIEVMDGISPETLNEINQNDMLELRSKPGVNVGYLAMNTEKKPFDSVKVRRAINHAINKKNLVKLLYRGMAVPAKSPVPPTLWGYADEVIDYQHNPKKARALLIEAGYDKGFSTTLWTMPIPRPYMPEPEKIAMMIKNNLASVGIQATIITHDWGTYLNKLSRGEHDMCLLGWIGENGDPDDFLYTLLDKDNAVKPYAGNVAFFKNDPLHRLLMSAQQSVKRERRAELYKYAQKIIHLEAPWVPLAHTMEMIAFNQSVKGLIQHPSGIVRFHDVWKE
jgi:peptide/nickel transport system substrate-binding protein